MYKSEVRAIQDMVEIMIIVVHLRRGELSFIHDILRGQRADVKAFRERTLYESDPKVLSPSLIF